MMIRKLSAAVMFAVLATSAYAGEAIKAANNQVKVSVVSQNFDYAEYDNYGMTNSWWLDTETGKQKGMALAVSAQGDVGPVENVFVSAELVKIDGTTSYDGYLQGGPSLIPYKTTTDYGSRDFTVKVGKGYQFGQTGMFQVTPYVASGKYDWDRDSSSDPYGYAEHYEHEFLAAGVLAQVELTPSLVVSADYMKGTTRSANMKLVADGTDFKLGSRPIETYAVGVDYSFKASYGSRMHVGAEYRQSKFSYGESPVVSGMLEPESRTIRKQVSLNLGYSWY